MNPNMTGNGPVDDPGTEVPETLRSWSVPWAGYAPVDITPPELRPDGITAGAAKAWAEMHAAPTDVPDWQSRQAAAIIPFGFDDRGWPLNPTGRTGRTGRNLGKWGENQAADPIVVAGSGTDRQVLLIRRGDCGQWAIPGGMVDPGETAATTLLRELAEETGVDLTGHDPVILSRTYVYDPRNTDHAWVTSTVALYQVPEPITATAADDATDARWFPFADAVRLRWALLDTGEDIYPAHGSPLVIALAHLDQQGAAEATGTVETRTGVHSAKNSRRTGLPSTHESEGGTSMADPASTTPGPDAVTAMRHRIGGETHRFLSVDDHGRLAVDVHALAALIVEIVAEHTTGVSA